MGNPITKKVKVLDASPSLWVDTTEVTVGRLKKFLSESDHPFDGELWAEVYEYSPTDKHPMIYASQCKPKKAENSNGGMKSEIL